MANQESGDSNNTQLSSLGQNHCDNKILQEVQERLKKQLLDRKNELDDRVYEQKGQLSRATKDREEVGVQLYDLQYHLSSIYTSLNKTTIALTIAAQAHIKARHELDGAQKHWDSCSEEHKNLSKKRNEIRQELDKVTRIIKKTQQFNKKIRGDVALHKLAAYATDEGMVGIELLKKKQDIAIEACQERIKIINKKVETAKAQIEAQKRESKISNTMLHEVDGKMESIHYEKKQMTSKWNSTIVALSRCDQAIKILRIAIHQQTESRLGMVSEQERYQKDIAKVAKMNESAIFILLQIDSSMSKIRKHVNFVKPRQKKISQQYTKIRTKVEKIQEYIELNIKDNSKMQAEAKKINKQGRREATKVHELENKMITDLFEKANLEEKGAEATIANIKELRKLIKGEDAKAIELNHELSRIQCDILAIQAHNEDIISTLKAVNDEITLKYNLISKFDNEIKQKDREVEKKTKEIMLLNRKCEQLTANFDDPNASSPMEAILYNLKQEVDQKVKESNEAQKRWLSLQSSLVILQKDVNILSEKVQHAAYDQGILTQRKYRVHMQYNIMTKAIHKLNKAIRQKQNLIIRLNDMIGRNKSLESSLVEITKNMQTEYYSALKDLATTTIELQSQINNSIVERDHAIKHLDELKHHVLLWRYKISFELKIQATIDPNVGSVELAALKKSVDRMQYELDSLNVQQKKLINDLDSKVDIRKVITIRIEAKCHQKGIQGPTGFEVGLVRVAGDLKKDVKNAHKSIAECDKRLIVLEKKKVDLSDKLLILNDKLSSSLAQQEDCKIKLKTIADARSRAFFKTAMYQSFAKKYEDFKNNKWRGVAVKKNVEEDLKDAQIKGTALIKLIKDLGEQLPIMQQKLDGLIVKIELALEAPQKIY